MDAGGKLCAAKGKNILGRFRWEEYSGEMPMTYEEKRSWLWRYQESLRRERELAEEVELLQSEATRITPLLSGMPGGAGDGQKLPRSAERIVKAKQELQEQIDLCTDIRGEIAEVIEQITNYRDHEILRRRYILGQKWEEIAVEMHYTYQHICNIHKAVVCNLILPGNS